tara:strand:- start:275 stop:580 length:306 start_codon:yes stop_codon:yes gene_type:complete
MTRRFQQADSNVDREFQDVDLRLTGLESRDDVPIGGMFLWSGSAPPQNYLWCNGETHNVNNFPELYKVLELRGGTPSPTTEGNFVVPSLTVGSFNFVIRAK